MNLSVLSRIYVFSFCWLLLFTFRLFSCLWTRWKCCTMCEFETRTRWWFLFLSFSLCVGPIGRVSIGCLGCLCQWLAVKCKKRFKRNFSTHSLTQLQSQWQTTTAAEKKYLNVFYNIDGCVVRNFVFTFVCSCRGFFRWLCIYVFRFLVNCLIFQSSVFGSVHGIVCCTLHCVNVFSFIYKRLLYCSCVCSGENVTRRKAVSQVSWFAVLFVYFMMRLSNFFF